MLDTGYRRRPRHWWDWKLPILCVLALLIIGYDASRLYPFFPRFHFSTTAPESSCISRNDFQDLNSNSTLPGPSPSENPPPLPLETHTYRPDGLLEVNSHGPHPIFELIKRAEKEWEEKLARASKSLEEAVVEYKRRYHRDPPPGFDEW